MPATSKRTKRQQAKQPPAARPAKPTTVDAPKMTGTQQAEWVGEVRQRTGATTVYTRKTSAQVGQQFRRVTLFFPVELHKAARIEAVKKDKPLSELVMQFVADGLGRQSQ